MKFICYEQLCSSRSYWLDILNFLDIKEIYEFSFKESYKEIKLDVDIQLKNKAMSLYKKLSATCLK